MKLDVRKFLEGQEFFLSETWNPDGYDLQAPGIRYEGVVKVQARAWRDAGVLQVDARAQGRQVRQCSRCGRDFTLDMDQSWRLVYSLDTAEPLIDLDGDVRGEMILSYPQKILCRPDCRGVCPGCGHDLNERGCSCKRQSADQAD